MAGVMILPEVLKRKSLFALLCKIDQDLAERTKANRCPFAGVHCITPITSESLGVGPQNLKKLLRFNSVCAAVVQVTVAVYCHPQFVFGIVGYTGRRFCCWSVHFVRDKSL